MFLLMKKDYNRYFVNPSNVKLGIQRSTKRKGGRRLLNQFFLEDRLAETNPEIYFYSTEHIRLGEINLMGKNVLLQITLDKPFLAPFVNPNRSSKEDRSYLPPKISKKNRLQYVKGNVKISCVQQKNLV